MTDKELRKLKRSELLEIMVVQSREIDRLTRELEDAKAQLASRELMFAETGSIAEASLKLYEVFEKAQAAADLYLENVRRITSEAAGEAAEAILTAQAAGTQAPEAAEAAVEETDASAKDGEKGADNEQ